MKNTNKPLLLLLILFLFLMFSFSVSGSTQERIIQTYGQAELTAEPDWVKINIAIETQNSFAEVAAQENARLANQVRDALIDFGLVEENIKTGSYRLYSFREWPKENHDEQSEQIYYQATNEIIITTQKLDDSGKIVDIAIQAGANHVNSIHFELIDSQKFILTALTEATKQARMKANAIVSGIGENITGIKSIKEERTTYSPYRFQEGMAQRLASSDPAATPITPDEVTITASVIAEFSF